jgi:hypothetical protein
VVPVKATQAKIRVTLPHALEGVTMAELEMDSALSPVSP